MKDLPFGAFGVLLRLILKLLMSKMSKTNFFPQFPESSDFTPKLNEKMDFFAKTKFAELIIY